jgi:hypothetical protein
MPAVLTMAASAAAIEYRVPNACQTCKPLAHADPVGPVVAVCACSIGDYLEASHPTEPPRTHTVGAAQPAWRLERLSSAICEACSCRCWLSRGW